ncbi:hypothetical protein QUB68_12370 [Microcoleus sp. A006_D1]|uniref:hypothetical protein n=1 Tax=Microcoleus sp. A006_D1 TaxID=3055267 RepID=UPI002FD0AAF4
MLSSCAPYKPIALAPGNSRGRHPLLAKGILLVARPIQEPRHRVFWVRAFFQQYPWKKL